MISPAEENRIIDQVLAGREDSYARLVEHYASVGTPENYVGEFNPGPRNLHLEMQAAAFAWLKLRLSQID